MKKDRIQLFEKFLDNLKRAKETARGDLAILKRACGFKLAESRNALGVFYRYLPSQLTKDYNEEIYFLVATLYGLNDYSHLGSFGTTMREVKDKRSGSESISNRMIALLDSRLEVKGKYYVGGGELAYRLRQCVRLASSHQVGVDWLQLLKDLIYWTHEDKFIQKNWARDFFSKPKIAPELLDSSENIQNKEKKIKKIN